MTSALSPGRSAELKEESLRRMRWRLWFAFAESKYDHFRYNGNKKHPHYENIKKYCREHWGKEIKDMAESELSERIAIVNKWK